MSPTGESDTEARGPFRLGEWLVEPVLNRISRGDAAVQLDPRTMDLLVFLARHPGDVLSQRAIMSGVWAAEFVGEGALRQTIASLRQALGDDVRNPTYIETISKRGYRLIAEITGLETAVSAPSEQRAEGFRPRWTHALAVAVAAVIALLVVLPPEGIWQRLTVVSEIPLVRSIAVLPLDNLSGDPEQEWFADSMTDALITELARIGGFDRVISSTTSRQYKATDKTMPEIARELGVDAILEGGILHAGDQVRINAQLVHAASDTHLWADSFQREVTDILALQAEIARGVAHAIRVQLTPDAELRLGKTRRVDPEAYEAYLMGRLFWAATTAEGYEKALQHFQRAVELDPTYAPAYAGIADSYAFLAIYGQWSPESWESSRQHALKALQLDGDLGEAHLAIANVTAWWDWEWIRADQLFRRAIELGESSSAAYLEYAAYLMAVRRFDEALQVARQGVERDPLGVHIRFMLASTLTQPYQTSADRYHEAIGLLVRTLEIEPDHPVLLWALFHAHIRNGERVLALDALERYLTASKWFSDDGVEEFRRVRSERPWSEALTWTAHVLEKRNQQQYVWSYHIALFYALADRHEEALRWLEVAYVARAALLGWANSDPAFEPLRSDPHFQDLLRRMNFPVE